MPNSVRKWLRIREIDGSLNGIIYGITNSIIDHYR